MSKTPKPPTVKEFMKRFPDDDSCLEHMLRTRWGAHWNCDKCNRDARYYRVKGRRCYECEHCGFQVYPTAGTPFQATRTSLRAWFYVMYLFCASRNGVSAKEVQRQIGVTYKTAWRMCHHIRLYMGQVDGDAPMGGPNFDGDPVVEIDHTFLGGHDKEGRDDKHVVLGIVERGGDVLARQVPNARQPYTLPVIGQYVRPGSKVATDEARVFMTLDVGFNHETVNHAQKEYVRGDIHTNTIESFWSALKRGINGTYIHVSSKHLQKYLWEFEYRHNLRRLPHLMMERLLRSFPKNDPTPWPSEAG